MFKWESQKISRNFKLSINKAAPKTATQLESSVIDFLANYHSTPHPLMNCSPAEMLNKRRLRTTLDLLHPCQTDVVQGRVHQKVNYDLYTKPCQYVIGDAVWIHNFHSEPHWIAGTVKKHAGRVMYEISVDGKDVIWHHHANQLRTRFASLKLTDTASATDKTQEQVPNQNQIPPEPRVHHRSTRIRKPRVPYKPS